MHIMAIDHGTTQSAFCLMDDRFTVLDKGNVANSAMLDYSG